MLLMNLGFYLHGGVPLIPIRGPVSPIDGDDHMARGPLVLHYSTFDIGAIFPSKTPGRLGRGARGTSRDRISTSTGNCRGVHL